MRLWEICEVLTGVQVVPAVPGSLMNERIWFVKRCRLFEALDSAELERLERRSRTRSFARGEMIYFPGDPGDQVLAVLSGRIKIKNITADGKESILAFIEEGELFGELTLLDDRPREDYAEAMAPSQLAAIPREAMLETMARWPNFTLHVHKLIGLRRRRIETRLKNLLFRSHRERLVRTLVELLDAHGEFRDGEWTLRIPLSHQDIASLIGATRETVTVTLGELQAEGLIRVRRCKIAIADKRRLYAEAGVSIPLAAPGMSQTAARRETLRPAGDR